MLNFNGMIVVHLRKNFVMRGVNKIFCFLATNCSFAVYATLLSGICSSILERLDGSYIFLKSLAYAVNN